MTKPTHRTDDTHHDVTHVVLASKHKAKHWEMSAHEALRVNYVTSTVYMPQAQMTAK